MAVRPTGRHRSWGSLLLLLAWFLLLPAGAAGAASHQTGVDLILLLDRSGSMAESDPEDLSLTGARALVSMLEPDDRVAVIAFDTGARTVLPLSRVGSGGAAREALDAVGPPRGRWTDIRGALEAASRALGGQTAGERRAAVVLFTDGRAETQPGGVPDGYYGAVDALVEQLALRAVPVFPAGLGEADFSMLGAIARGTRAESFAAASPAQVVRLFAEVLGRVKGREMAVSFTDHLAPGEQGEERMLRVPPYTRLLTVTAVGSAGKVRALGVSPSGTRLDEAPGLVVTQGGRYAVYTIPDPESGLWRIRLEGAGEVAGFGQVESALRLRLLEPPPYSQVDLDGPVEVAVALDGELSAGTQLAVWGQSGSGKAVRLARDGHIFTGMVEMAPSGDLVVWATLGGEQLFRHAFRLYPVKEPPLVMDAMAHLGVSQRTAAWVEPALYAAGAAGAAGLFIAAGGWNWRRMRRREEALAGRLGPLRLDGCGREAVIGPGPVLLRGGPVAVGRGGSGEPHRPGGSGRGEPLATLTAHLVSRTWAPLAGLGLGGRELRIHIRPARGVRLQINGRPAGDGRLYHGDEIVLGSEAYPYRNPRLTRRPARQRVRPFRSGSGPSTTLNR